MENSIAVALVLYRCGRVSKAEILDLLLECKRLEHEHKEKSAIYGSYVKYLKNALKDGKEN
jgi:hypothetical protein